MEQVYARAPGLCLCSTITLPHSSLNSLFTVSSVTHLSETEMHKPLKYSQVQWEQYLPSQCALHLNQKSLSHGSLQFYSTYSFLKCSYNELYSLFVQLPNQQGLCSTPAEPDSETLPP